MKRITITLIACVVVVANTASAELVRGIEIEFVTIGNAGNVADASGYGAVDYEYQIGKYEVTNAQWDLFVATAGAPTGIPSFAYDDNTFWAGDSIPASMVSWYEAVQFCNYLTSGDKSQGVYLFSGNNANPGEFLGVDRDAAGAAYSRIFCLPTEDEWYKAAYYTGSGYSLYANGTDVAPIAGDYTNYNLAIGQPWDIGNGTMEQNGTFNMMGNIGEWNETEFDFVRGYRGGAYNSAHSMIMSSGHSTTTPNLEDFNIGFRVASVPEPATLALLTLGGFGLLRKRR